MITIWKLHCFNRTNCEVDRLSAELLDELERSRSENIEMSFSNHDPCPNSFSRRSTKKKSNKAARASSLNKIDTSQKKIARPHQRSSSTNLSDTRKMKKVKIDNYSNTYSKYNYNSNNNKTLKFSKDDTFYEADSALDFINSLENSDFSDDRDRDRNHEDADLLITSSNSNKSQSQNHFPLNSLMSTSGNTGNSVKFKENLTTFGSDLDFNYTSSRGRSRKISQNNTSKTRKSMARSASTKSNISNISAFTNYPDPRSSDSYRERRRSLAYFNKVKTDVDVCLRMCCQTSNRLSCYSIICMFGYCLNIIYFFYSNSNFEITFTIVLLNFLSTSLSLVLCHDDSYEMKKMSISQNLY